MTLSNREEATGFTLPKRMFSISRVPAFRSLAGANLRVGNSKNVNRQAFREKFEEYAKSNGGSNASGYGAAFAAMSQVGVAVVGTAAAVSAINYSMSRTGSADPVPNCAFVFIKPHANTSTARRVVKEQLQAKGMTVLDEGLIKGADIDKKQLIDNHYYAIASKATILSPEQLNVPPEKFKAQFGLEWKDALAQKKVFNAKQACEKTGLSPDELNAEWAKAKKAGKLVKFGGGFYCGLINTIPGQGDMYVFNGFFMTMRQGTMIEPLTIH